MVAVQNPFTCPFHTFIHVVTIPVTNFLHYSAVRFYSCYLSSENSDEVTCTVHFLIQSHTHSLTCILNHARQTHVQKYLAFTHGFTERERERDTEREREREIERERDRDVHLRNIFFHSTLSCSAAGANKASCARG